MEAVELDLDHAQSDLSLHHGLGLSHGLELVLLPGDIFLKFSFFLFHERLIPEQFGDEHF